uniref:Si:ch73-132f6.5 n=1 Tax=Sinocyclocheilus anshuiensis TaxID=1608454 RepID=A0A671LGD2_9TELE
MTNLARISGSLHRLTVRVCSASPLPFCRNNALYSHSFSESATTVRCFTRDSRYRSSNRHYASSAHKTVRIGCASGFWGDTATSVPQLIYGGKLDFLVFDYLSEITMSLLSAAKAKAPNMGYAPDFVLSLSPFIKDISKKGIRVVSNAGGVNPLACGAALQEVVQKAGLDLKVAVVTGDDLMPQKDSLTELRMPDSEGKKPLPKTVHSMNAYLGALPIKRCLDLGADIVVTRRCVDSAVVLGPLMHSVRLAGHLIECGAQATGGIFTDWHMVPDWDNMGFPVVECSADGSFTLSKPPNTGGLVSFGTVRYLLPDVTCDFSSVTITEIPDVDGGAVKVDGAKGSPPSADYKVCATYMDGFRATAVCPVGGLRAVEKARRTAQSIIKRTQRIFKQLGLEDYAEVNIQVLGAEDTYGPHAVDTSPREAVVWMAVHHKQKKALELFSREVAPAGTGMGEQKPQSPVLKPFFFLHPKVHIHVNGELVETHREAALEPSLAEGHDPSLRSEENSPTPTDLPSGPHTFRLDELAVETKGTPQTSVRVTARHPLYFPYLKKCLTAEVVEQYFQHLIRKDQTDLPSVIRYELPGIHGLNFILPNSLGGGGVASLRSDPQGKAYGQMLLDYKLRGLPDLKSLVD